MMKLEKFIKQETMVLRGYTLATQVVVGYVDLLNGKKGQITLKIETDESEWSDCEPTKIDEFEEFKDDTKKD